MKVIFLDIDGVLTNGNSISARSIKTERGSLSKKIRNNIFRLLYNTSKRIKINSFATSTILGLIVYGDTLGLDNNSVIFLNTIIKRTDVKIVVSSTHRLHASNNLAVMKFLMYFQMKVRDVNRVIGMTDTKHCEHRRGGQIQRWLDKNPLVTHYAIVDDDSDMMDHQLPYFVHTPNGLMYDEFEKIISILDYDLKTVRGY